jgi:uncharacterized membrane protein
MDYSTLKWLHILSAMLLFGTGLGSAFHLYAAWRLDDARHFTLTARQVIWADWLFTTPAVIFQLASGLVLARMAGWPLTQGWLLHALLLFLLAGAAWLPVVWLQIRIHRQCVDQTRIPAGAHHLMRLWTLLGAIAFPATLAILYLMTVKP